MRAARTKEGGDILKTYWYHQRIWHYGVLNLEVKPWEALIKDTRIKQVFEFLKELTDLQGKFKKAHPEPPSPPRGFIALGVRVWPANVVPFLAAIDEEFEKWFLPGGFISLTHIIEAEFIGGYKESWISGGAPYRLAPHSSNTNVLGMTFVRPVYDLQKLATRGAQHMWVLCCRWWTVVTASGLVIVLGLLVIRLELVRQGDLAHPRNNCRR
ncbi:hypothetical protein MRX96_024542 [Rhipicephalus microplus]